MQRGSGSDAPSCSVSGGGSGSDSRARDSADRNGVDSQAQLAEQPHEAPEHNIFGGAAYKPQVICMKGSDERLVLIRALVCTCVRATTDSNLNMVMAFMLLLHFMQYAMRPPCGC